MLTLIQGTMEHPIHSLNYIWPLTNVYIQISPTLKQATECPLRAAPLPQEPILMNPICIPPPATEQMVTIIFIPPTATWSPINITTSASVQRVLILFKNPTATEPHLDLSKRHHQKTSHPKPRNHRQYPSIFLKSPSAHATTIQHYAHYIDTLSTTPTTYGIAGSIMKLIHGTKKNSGNMVLPTNGFASYTWVLV